MIAGERFLVVRLGAIGDVLRVLPAVRQLRLARPRATIGWVVENWVQPILAGNPNVDRVHVLDRRRLKEGPLAVLNEVSRLRRELRLARYDTALDFHGRLKSGLVTRLSGAPRRIGYARGDCSEGNHLFTNVHVRLEDRWENRVLRFLHLLPAAGIDAQFDTDDTGVYVAPKDVARAAAWYESVGQPPVAAFPGTSAGREYSRWPVDKWAACLRLLRRDGIRTVVFWGPADAGYVRAIVSAADEAGEEAPPTTLPEMMAMLARFRVFIGANTAAMHMAWLQKVPVAVFPGPVRPRTDAPLPPNPSRILWANDRYRPGVRRARQPDVVREVSVDAAVRAVHELLDGF